MKNWVIGLTVVLLVVLWKTGDLTYAVMKEKNHWEQQGTTMAEQYAGMVKVDKVSFYHGDQRYLVVQGENSDGAKLIAWFREGGIREGLEFEQNLVSKDIIKEKLQTGTPGIRIVRVQPGIEERTPVWETVWLDSEGKYNYSYYDMKTGNFIRSYRLQNIGM